MALDQVEVLMSGIQTVAIVLSLVALIWQLRQITNGMRQDAYSRVLEDYSRISERLLDNPALNRFFYDGNDDFAKLSEEERAFYNYLGLSLAFFERVYLLHRQRRIDTGIWASWERWLRGGWLKVKLFPIFWARERDYFSADFSAFVDQAIRQVAAAPLELSQTHSTAEAEQLGRDAISAPGKSVEPSKAPRQGGVDL